MKMIMNEWKKWLLETAPTEKRLGQPERDRSGHYDRAARDMERGETYREVAKTYIRNYLTSDRGADFLNKLNDELEPDEIDKIIKDVNIMKWIYDGNTDYQTKTSVTVHQEMDRTVTMYDTRYSVAGNPVRKLSNVLSILGAPEDPPNTNYSNEDVLDVYKFYINTNYNPAPEEPKSSRFAGRAAGLADFYKNFKRQ
tara:strand:+ start:23 stop:613 length:591 start_codon:yes stop_codon:yes gene_type:complete